MAVLVKCLPPETMTAAAASELVRRAVLGVDSVASAVLGPFPGAQQPPQPQEQKPQQQEQPGHPLAATGVGSMNVSDAAAAAAALKVAIMFSSYAAGRGRSAGLEEAEAPARTPAGRKPKLSPQRRLAQAKVAAKLEVAAAAAAALGDLAPPWWLESLLPLVDARYPPARSPEDWARNRAARLLLFLQGRVRAEVQRQLSMPWLLSKLRRERVTRTSKRGVRV